MVYGKMLIGWVRTAIRFTIYEPAPWDVSYTIPSGLYNCRKYSTNHTILCKTKPISKSYHCPQTLFNNQLTKIFAAFSTQKTKPIQSQTKPILKMTKMNANSVLTKDYEQKTTFFRRKNKANSKPISKMPKINANSVLTNCYESNPPWKAKKTKPIQSQFLQR